MSLPKWRGSSVRAGIVAAVLIVAAAGLFGIFHRSAGKPSVSPAPQQAVTPAPVIPAPEREDPAMATLPAVEDGPQDVEEAALPPSVPPDGNAAPPPPAAATTPVSPQVPPAMMEGRGGEPAWRRYAVASPPTHGRPMVAVIIDDVGVDRKRADKIVTLPGPLTLSFMSYAADLARQTAAARRHGHELMMHMPMEPMSGSVDPGPDALLTTLAPAEVKRRLESNLGRFQGYVGINNHMGSRFTASEAGMDLVMESLRHHGLLFVDSMTSAQSVGMKVAARHGVPALARSVFLDNVEEVGAIRAQLAKVEETARKRGAAIAIGHPHDATREALAEWLPGLTAKGLVLVPVSAMVAAKGTPPFVASH